MLRGCRNSESPSFHATRDRPAVRKTSALILELFPQFKIVLLEIALDFPLESVVDISFVRQHHALRKNVDAARRNYTSRKMG